MHEAIGRIDASEQSLCQWLKSNIGIIVRHDEDEDRMRDHIVPPDGLAHVARQGGKCHDAGIYRGP